MVRVRGEEGDDDCLRLLGCGTVGGDIPRAGASIKRVEEVNFLIGANGCDCGEHVIAAVKQKPAVVGYRLHEDAEENIRAAGGRSHNAAVGLGSPRGIEQQRSPAGPVLDGSPVRSEPLRTTLLDLLVLLLIAEGWAANVDRAVAEDLCLAPCLPQQSSQPKDAFAFVGSVVK